MARPGRDCGRPRAGLLLILLLSSLEGYSLAARVELGFEEILSATGGGSSNATVARVPNGGASRPVLAAGDQPRGPEVASSDLQCVAVLCWLETFQSNAGKAAKAFVETDRAIAMANAAGVELGKHGIAAAADVGLAGSIFGGILNAIKVKAEGCKGSAFNCVGKASLAVVVISVLAICVFVVGHIFAVAAAVTAGAGLSLGSLGFFFANVFKYLCDDGLNENSATKLVQQSAKSLTDDNPGVGKSLSDEDQNRVVVMLTQVQAARRRINGDSDLSARIAREGAVARGFQNLLGLHTLKDVRGFCDSLQVAFNLKDPSVALREERNGGEYIDEDDIGFVTD